MRAQTSASSRPEGSVEPIKLVALDIDGTLLDGERLIPEANRWAISRAREKGVKVVLATARAFLSAMPFAQELNLDTPLICTNGALIKDLADVEWWSKRIQLDVARQIAAWADAGGHVLVTLIGDYIYYTWSAPWVGEGWEPRPYDRVVGSNLAPLTTPPLCITAVGEETSRALLDRFAFQVGGKVRFDRYERDGRLLSVIAVHAAATKEGALAFLCARWGLSASQTMALGDNLPDLGMLRWAGIGVAMGNAPLEMHERVKWVAPSNDQAGVAWAIERFVLGEEDL